MTLRPRAVILVAVTALAAVGGFVSYRLLDRTPEVRAATAPADSAPERDDTSRARTVPETLPAFTLADRDGVARSLADWPDRPLIVNFWATWCAPCRREIPLLMQLRRDWAADGVEVIGIAVDFREDVLRYASEMKIDYPLLIGEQEGLDAAAAFGLEPVFPFTAFSDRRGRIVALRVGELHADEADLILERIRAVDRGELELDVARLEIARGLEALSAARAAITPESGKT
jgi:thiol-disulfide isomerase/thioredoxin